MSADMVLRGRSFEIRPSVEGDLGAILSGVQVNNATAICFWQRNGYEIVGGPTLMPDTTTVYLLRKELRPDSRSWILSE